MKISQKHHILIGVMVVLLVGLCGLGYLVGVYQRTTSERLADKYSGQIDRLISQIDHDGDGLDDQTDILNGAIRYINSQPKYQSKYYTGGYPDDGYGVCTDLVAAALKEAGYDLRELVNEDIRNNSVVYEIDYPDKDIDYRRVRNLRIFFDRNATKLTTDIYQIDQWQGGDIVVFNNHIGIVSDRRNSKGVPYVIHHASPWQRRYEQDILENRTDLVGHYRMGAKKIIED